jgi:predicted ATP-dependent serine protease
MTGWNMPPGVNERDIPGNEDYVCECCGHESADCICQECPVCEEYGNLECYKKGHLKFNKMQLIGQARMRVSRIQDQIADEESYITWLSEQPDDSLYTFCGNVNTGGDRG